MAGDEPPTHEWETHPGRATEESSVARALDVNISESILELQLAFTAIAHPRRRYLLYTLTQETEWSLENLATKLAAWEAETDESNISTLTRQEMYTSLYHAHIPKLVELNVIEFDADTETITPGQHALQVLTLLEGVGGSIDSRQEAHARSEFNREENTQ